MHIMNEVVTRSSQQSKTRLFRDAINNYPLASVKAAFILHWAFCNGISNNVLDESEMISGLLQSASPNFAFPSSRIRAAFPYLDLKNLESVFESLIKPDARKTFGAVYTPDYIADYLIREGLQFGWHERDKLPKIYDPSCGCAGFLIRAAEILHEDYDIEPANAFQACLFGSDKDVLALENARCFIELYLISRGVRLSETTIRLFERDALLDDRSEIDAAMGESIAFNLVATNPPYVKLQNLDLEYRASLIQKYPDYTRGSFSLAPLFMLANQNALAPEGCLAFITQNNLFTSLSSVEARLHLQRKQCIRRIIDFGHHKVFENASAYTCLLFLGTSSRDEFEYENIDRGVNNASLQNAKFTKIRHDSLRPEKWRLVQKDHADNIKMIETIGNPLGAVASIRVGFATLKDAIFIVRDRGEYCDAVGIDGCTYSIEKNLTRSAVKIADLASAEDLPCNNRRVIFPYQRYGNKYQIIPENQLASEYPNAYRYLIASKDLLNTRDSGRKEYTAWYAWGRTQGMDAVGPKLLTKTFSKRPQFMRDDSDQLFCNGYAVSERADVSLFNQVPLSVLERILNSSVMHYYAKLTSFQIEGNYQCYQKNFIERFGIVDITEQQVQELVALPLHEADTYVVNLYGLRLDALNQVLYQS